MENRIQYRGNGEVTEFFYNFVIFAAGDMEVYLDDALQVSGYEVVGAGDKEGGKVVFEKAPASGVLVTLSRKLEISRRSDFQEGGVLRSKILNYEFDYIMACLQQISAAIDRTMILPAYAEDVNLKLPSPSCGKAILWNEDASGLCNSDVDINNLDAALTEAVATTTANAAATAEQSAIATAQAAVATEKAEEATRAAEAAEEATLQKLDTDVENISAEGKKNIIVWGMPDYDKAVDKVPEELYTAPCNGYVFLHARGNPTIEKEPYGMYLEVGSTESNLQKFYARYGAMPQNGNLGSSIMLPLTKDDVYRCTGLGSAPRFVFIPCRGEA